MVFGNLGESLELLAIKIGRYSFAQDHEATHHSDRFHQRGCFLLSEQRPAGIQTKFYSLLISIRQASPELDVPEGVFYKEIDGYNLYVGKARTRESGMLYDVLIYDVASGFNNMAVIFCDSAK